jgi:hypothetical protein
MQAFVRVTRFAGGFADLDHAARRWLLAYHDGVDGAPNGIDVPRWSLSLPI